MTWNWRPVNPFLDPLIGPKKRYLLAKHKIKYTYTQLADGVNRPVLQLLVEQQDCELNVIWFDLPHIEQSAEHPYITKFIPISVYEADCFE